MYLIALKTGDRLEKSINSIVPTERELFINTIQQQLQTATLQHRTSYVCM